MNYNEYATAKINSYTKLGWKVDRVVTTDTEVTFFTTDNAKTKRKHTFNENDIKVEVVADYDALEPTPVVLPVEEVVEEVVVEEPVPVVEPKKKTKKSKKTESE